MTDKLPSHLRLSDEILEHHAAVFLALKIQTLLNITFEKFLVHSEFYTDRAIDMIYGGGVIINNGMMTSVERS